MSSWPCADHSTQRRSLKRSRCESCHRRQAHGYQNLSDVDLTLDLSKYQSVHRKDEFVITRIKIDSFDLTERYAAIPYARGFRQNGSNEDKVAPIRERATFGIHYKTSVLPTDIDELVISLFGGTNRILIPVAHNVTSIMYNRHESMFTILWKMIASFQTREQQRTYSPCSDFTHGRLSKSNGLIQIWVDRQSWKKMHFAWQLGDFKSILDHNSFIYQHDILHVEDASQVTTFDELVAFWADYSTISTLRDREMLKSRLQSLNYLFTLCLDVLTNSDPVPTETLSALVGFVSETWNVALEPSVVIYRLKELIFPVGISSLWKCLDNMCSGNDNLFNK